jgi:tRNA pseudouridine13 synthase
MSDHPEDSARPAKRARLDDDSNTAPSLSTQAPAEAIAPEAGDTDLEREVRAGITEYVCPDNLGFTGVLKQRYTDFLVNEIGLDGKVLHLKSTDVPKKEKKKQEVKESDVHKVVALKEENGDTAMLDVKIDGEEVLPKKEHAPVQEEEVKPEVTAEPQAKKEEEKTEAEVEASLQLILYGILLTTPSLLKRIAPHSTTFSAKIPRIR